MGLSLSKIRRLASQKAMAIIEQLLQASVRRIPCIATFSCVVYKVEQAAIQGNVQYLLQV